MWYHTLISYYLVWYHIGVCHFRTLPSWTIILHLSYYIHFIGQVGSKFFPHTCSMLQRHVWFDASALLPLCWQEEEELGDYCPPHPLWAQWRCWFRAWWGACPRADPLESGYIHQLHQEAGGYILNVRQLCLICWYNGMALWKGWHIIAARWQSGSKPYYL